MQNKLTAQQKAKKKYQAKFINVSLDKELHSLIKDICIKNNLTINEFIKLILNHNFKKA